LKISDCRFIESICNQSSICNLKSRVLQKLLAGLLAAALVSGQGAGTYTGVITDETCAKGGHATMRMGPTDAECTVACVDSHGVAYALADGKNVYGLTGDQPFAKFAGRRVRVTGVLDAKAGTIAVDSIAAPD
jgi:hypothetical protein